MSGSTTAPGRGARLRDGLAFLATNRIPRNALSRAMGRISRVESPLLVAAALAVWRRFDGDFRLHEAQKQRFDSIQDFFTRQLRPGVRPLEASSDCLASPCDGILGECGTIDDDRVYQAKGFPYTIGELMVDNDLVERYRGGTFVTLRLKSSMYHRFHAPADGTLRAVTYVAGERWNVHPPALKRIDRLFCKNERAVIDSHGDDRSQDVCLVAVAAVLVSSIRLHCLVDHALPPGRTRKVSLQATVRAGDELGYFEHGSTIVLFSKSAFRLRAGLQTGDRVFMGQALLQRAVPTTT